MNAIDERAIFERLEPEWHRIEALALCLVETRQGREPPAELIQTLERLQDQVSAAREAPGFAHQLDVAGLNGIELDALFAVTAPEIEPRIGWIFQNLQNGGPFPSAALLQDLFAMRGQEIALLRRALAPQGPLKSRRLIQHGVADPYAAIRLDEAALSLLLGWRDVASPPTGATRVQSLASWDDLVLPPLQIRMLQEFVLWIRGRATVVGAWGGSEVGGPVALFSGPSGTGKTLAASVIAHELGWPLYRVDLGKIVSKYIGETEKNLNALFDAAHGREMVLQFDEADALFGKRAEVKEARDRYANMEVSHILSRIEQHRGPCILTTNLRSHLDTAFLRRFQAVIEFPRPDAQARAGLWARLLPRNAPIEAGIDRDMLGEAVALTGGGIRNAALHAAYLAAGGNRAISHADIALGVWRELGKAGKPVSINELGGLAPHLEEGGR